MGYTETYRSQLGLSPVLGTLPGAVRSNDLRSGLRLVHQSRRRNQPIAPRDFCGEGAAFDAYRAMSVSDKLKILNGEGGSQDAGADMDDTGMGFGPCDDFESDSPIRKLGRAALWHCECLYYQMVGQWVGDRLHGLKQRFSNLPGPARAEVSCR